MTEWPDKILRNILRNSTEFSAEKDLAFFTFNQSEITFTSPIPQCTTAIIGVVNDKATFKAIRNGQTHSRVTIADLEDHKFIAHLVIPAKKEMPMA